ncbi:MAG: transketolase C-terminal domain-containing protein [candidate division KSB1 bacterium]|nr:transketolase C-terminal domain-containing protein [candidate division KSB1 bacterium]
MKRSGCRNKYTSTCLIFKLRVKPKEKEWNDLFARYKKEYPELAEQFENAVSGTLASDWDSAIKAYKPEDGPQATRNIGGQVMNAIADKVPFLIGGSADLNPSTKTFIENSDYVAKNAYQNKNIAWGVRELGMCGATSGIALHGGLRPFASTFFVFSDYARPAIRLAAIMKVPAIYVMTHDSIGVGEDGPTHQPVEHMAALRCIPGLTVIRPADANETAWAWRAAIKNTDGPTMLLFTRQKLPVIDQAAYAPASGVLKGAYILCKEDGNTPDVILIATGSEVPLVLEAQKQLKSSNIDARVVSMPSWELFRQQNDSYRDEVLPPKIKARLAVEAGVSQGWSEWVGADGDVLSLNAFGKSGPYSKVFEHFGLTPDNIVKRAKALL